MIIGTPACRAQPLSLMQGLGYQCAEVEDAYAAMAELCRRPLVYRSMILALSSLFREELQVIATVKRRFPHVDIYLSGIEGRQAALAEAMRLGADGLLAEDGLHRTAGIEHPEAVGIPTEPPSQAPANKPPGSDPDGPPEEEESTEPILTAEELQALLEEHEPSR